MLESKTIKPWRKAARPLLEDKSFIFNIELWDVKLNLRCTQWTSEVEEFAFGMVEVVMMMKSHDVRLCKLYLSQRLTACFFPPWCYLQVWQLSLVDMQAPEWALGLFPASVRSLPGGTVHLDAGSLNQLICSLIHSFIHSVYLLGLLSTQFTSGTVLGIHRRLGLSSCLWGPHSPAR